MEKILLMLLAQMMVMVSAMARGAGTIGFWTFMVVSVAGWMLFSLSYSL